jgi:hypothetical protein
MAKPPTPLSLVGLASSLPEPPTSLGPAGIALWKAIMNDYVVADAGGLTLLEEACCARDRAEKLRIEIDRDGEILHTARGLKEHPGLKAELAARAFITRTLQRLGINLEVVRPSPGRPAGAGWKGRHAD